MAEYRIRDLTKSFELNKKMINVIRGLNLTGDSDEITVILGRSGCGKTTLLKVLCGLEIADEGEMEFPKGNQISMVFQEPCLMPWLNVEKNINFGLKRNEIESERTAKLIKVTGLQGFEKAYPVQLSGGMQHRVALARALACKPEMILMDEPFAALDYFTREAMQKELLRIHRETGMGGIFVTHNIDEAIILGDHICIMSQGVISEEFYQKNADVERNLLSRESIDLKQKILSKL